MNNQNWYKTYENGNEDYTYFCGCGAEMDDDLEYNANTGTYICLNCGYESPDLENIEKCDENERKT